MRTVGWAACPVGVPLHIHQCAPTVERMSLRGFFRALFRSSDSDRRSKHSGDQLASEIRETVGPLAGGPGAGDGGGRMTGNSVYHHLEDRKRD